MNYLAFDIVRSFVLTNVVSKYMKNTFSSIPSIKLSMHIFIPKIQIYVDEKLDILVAPLSWGWD